MTHNSSSFETTIIYAGVMKFLMGNRTASVPASISSDAELERFSAIRDLLPGEMRETLFELLKIYIMMERQKILGTVPVFRSYKRLPPLFYYLSGTEAVYYTVEDKLLRMKPMKTARRIAEEEAIRVRNAKRAAREQAASIRNAKKILLSPEEERKEREEIEKEDELVRQSADPEAKLINDTAKEIQQIEALAPRLTDEQRVTLNRLKRENAVRIAEREAILYSAGCSNEIEHRELKELTIDERRELLGPGSQVKEAIISCHERFTKTYIREHTIQDLRNKTTPIGIALAPIYNFGMSMEETFERVKNHTDKNPNPRGQPIRPYDKLLKHCVENNKTLHTLSTNPEKNADALVVAYEELDDLAARFAKQLANYSDEVKEMSAQQGRRVWAPAEF